MKRADIVPGQAYLAANGKDAAQGGGYSRRRVIVLDNRPYIKTTDRAAVPEQKGWNGQVRYPAVPFQPAATTSFTFPALPGSGKVTVRAVRDTSGRGTMLPVLVEGRDWTGLLTGEWDFSLVTSREIVDTWEHAEEVVAQRRQARLTAAQVTAAAKEAAEARLEALEGRLGAFGLKAPLRVGTRDLTISYTATGASVADLLEDLVGRLEEALDAAV